MPSSVPYALSYCLVLFIPCYQVHCKATMRTCRTTGRGWVGLLLTRTQGDLAAIMPGEQAPSVWTGSKNDAQRTAHILQGLACRTK